MTAAEAKSIAEWWQDPISGYRWIFYRIAGNQGSISWLDLEAKARTEHPITWLAMDNTEREAAREQAFFAHIAAEASGRLTEGQQVAALHRPAKLRA